MRPIPSEDLVTLADWLPAEAPGPDAIVGHVATTGHGRAWADRWPRPSAVLAETGGNYLLAGAPAAVDPAALRPLVTGFLAAAGDFDGVLDQAFPDRVQWDRVVYRLPDQPPGTTWPPAALVATAPLAATVRRLRPSDALALEQLSDAVRWVAKTWGDPTGLALSGHAYGAFAAGRLAAVTCTFFLGARHADAGVATEPELRGHGFGLATARAWCAGTVAAGKVPTWTTSPDNTPSRRIAERLGFELVREDVLHVIGVDIPS